MSDKKEHHEPQIIRLESLDLSYEIEDIVFTETGVSIKDFTDKLLSLEKTYKEKYKDNVQCNIYLYQYYDTSKLQFLVYTIETPEQVEERLDKIRNKEKNKAKNKVMTQLSKLDKKTRNEILERLNLEGD